MVCLLLAICLLFGSQFVYCLVVYLLFGGMFAVGQLVVCCYGCNRVTGLSWPLSHFPSSELHVFVCLFVFVADARGVVIDPEKYTVHDVTGTLKLFLHSLPDPVLTKALYPNFIATIRKHACKTLLVGGAPL